MILSEDDLAICSELNGKGLSSGNEINSSGDLQYVIDYLGKYVSVGNINNHIITIYGKSFYVPYLGIGKTVGWTINDDIVNKDEIEFFLLAIFTEIDEFSKNANAYVWIVE